MTEVYHQIDWLSRNEGALMLMADRIMTTALAKRVTYAFGNGGSCSQADHFVGELLGAYMVRSRRPIMAINLGAQPTSLTAIANDYGWENYLERCVQAMDRNDFLLLLTTSCKSRNIVKVLEENAHNPHAPRMGLITGAGIGDDSVLSGLPITTLPRIVINSRVVSDIQESTLAWIHRLCALVEKRICEQPVTP